MLITKRIRHSTLTDNALDKELQDQAINLPQLLGVLVLIVVTVVSVFVGVRHVQASDPYIQDVLALDGNADRGQEIFQMNCAVCHGIEANGEVGPSLLGVSARKSKVKLIKQVVSGNTPPMPQFQPKPEDMADLLEYLEQL
jgi:mono/diheme cytochrome c family protein